MFFNLFAPGTVGGDVSRVVYLARDQESHAKGRAVTTTHAAMSVLMDRAIGMIVLVWLGAAGLLLFPEYAVPPTVRSITLCSRRVLSARFCFCRCSGVCYPRTAIRWSSKSA